MKRLCLLLAVPVISLVAILVFVPEHVGAGVDDFHFSSFEADYYLSKDDEGRSTMKVVESLTAEFNNVDQNKGIIRAIPGFYDGHRLSFNLVSLTRNGQNEPIYEQTQESEFFVVSTGTDKYVNGTQNYIFTYTLRDVTKDFGAHQELYWDTNGTGWSQSFDNLNVRVHLDDSVYKDFNGDVSCYKGVEGSKTSCYHSSDGKTVTFSSGGPLYPYENLTMNLSFAAGTFSGYEWNIFDFMPFVLLAVAVLLLVVATIIKFRYGRDNRGRGTIVAEYLPPKGVSVLLSSEIFDKTAAASTAQILDLAVRHKIRIIESEDKVLFFNTQRYTLELLDMNGLEKDELDFVNILFSGAKVGSKYEMSKTSSSMSVMIASQIKRIRRESEELGYRLRQKRLVVIQSAVIIAMFISLVLALFISVSNFSTNGVIFGFMIVLLIIIINIFQIGSLRPLTPKGRELLDYLKGLKMYIELAEADRIKVLQSPAGAEKIPVNTNDSASMVVLYERVLPYAVLFGQETEWLKQLGVYYESTKSSPSWYSGTSAFDAASFASSVGSFTSYSNSSSSSSSSGAGGGGSSGGGGGGGGGGGR